MLGKVVQREVAHSRCTFLLPTVFAMVIRVEHS